MKKLPGRRVSSKLLYDKSSTSSTGKAPNPRGRLLRRFIDTFKIRSFGMDEMELGTSSSKLFERFKISKFVKFAMLGGRTKIFYFKFLIKIFKVSTLKITNLLFYYDSESNE